MIEITYKNRDGHKYHDVYEDRQDATERLATLLELEGNTVQYAPTDSGLTRNTYKAEMKALQAALGQQV